MKNKVIILAIATVIIVIAAAIIIKSQHTNTTAQNTVSEDSRVKGVSTQNENDSDNSNQVLKTISVDEAKHLIAENIENANFIIIDVRTPEEFAKGHIDRAINLDFYNSFDQQMKNLDKNKRYLIYCRSGNRSSQAMSLFKEQGFTEIHEISGGYNAWIQE